MNKPALGILVAFCLFLGMVLLLELGRRMGNRRQSREAERARAGLGAVEGSIFGLMGLLIAFTFSSAASRFETRRQLITDEANCIGTAWLRIDLVPSDAQPALRTLLRQYLGARLAVYRGIEDWTTAHVQIQRAEALHQEIWAKAIEAACRTNMSPSVPTLVLPALNQMFDISSTRTTAAKAHGPRIVFFMLGALALLSSLLAGYGMAGAKSQSWAHILGFAAVIALTVFVILDLEFPRIGFIRLDAADQVLIQLRQTMGE